ncbi:MAG: hypothetical protein V2A54_11125 [Bacteroidota bacterium]
MNAIEIVLAILIIVPSFFLTLFLWANVMRLLKKKSHHHIIHPAPEKDKNWYPIDFIKYDCFLFVRGTNGEILNQWINSILISENELFNNQNENIYFRVSSDVIILKIANCSYQYFTMLAWLLNTSLDKVQLTGYCKHKRLSSEDYIFNADPSAEVEYFIGSFRNGRNFGISVSTIGNNESGNISLSANQEVNFYSELEKLPINDLDNKDVVYKEILLEV